MHHRGHFTIPSLYTSQQHCFGSNKSKGGNSWRPSKKTGTDLIYIFIIITILKVLCTFIQRGLTPEPQANKSWKLFVLWNLAFFPLIQFLFIKHKEWSSKKIIKYLAFIKSKRFKFISLKNVQPRSKIHQWHYQICLKTKKTRQSYSPCLWCLVGFWKIFWLQELSCIIWRMNYLQCVIIYNQHSKYAPSKN